MKQQLTLLEVAPITERLSVNAHLNQACANGLISPLNYVFPRWYQYEDATVFYALSANAIVPGSITSHRSH